MVRDEVPAEVSPDNDWGAVADASAHLRVSIKEPDEPMGRRTPNRSADHPAGILQLRADLSAHEMVPSRAQRCGARGTDWSEQLFRVGGGCGNHAFRS